MTTVFEVPGLPVPQGSKRIGRHGLHAVILDDNDAKLRPWRQTIATYARRAYRGQPLATPLAVKLVFALPAPKRLPAGRVMPSVRPDVDKLARAALDGMTGIVYADDALICHLDVWKVYATPGRDLGVRITIKPIDGAVATLEAIA